MAQWHSMTDRSIVSASQHSRALAALHLAVLLFGFAGLFGKWLPLPPVTIVFGRAAVASLVLALLLPRAGERRETRGSFEWKLAASGSLLALHWVAFFQAIQLASVAVGLLGFASFPLFVLLLEGALRSRIRCSSAVCVRCLRTPRASSRRWSRCTASRWRFCCSARRRRRERWPVRP